MHAVHDKLEAETLQAKNVAFNSASSGRKVTGDIPQPGSTCLQQMRYNLFQ